MSAPPGTTKAKSRTIGASLCFLVALMIPACSDDPVASDVESALVRGEQTITVTDYAAMKQDTFFIDVIEFAYPHPYGAEGLYIFEGRVPHTIDASLCYFVWSVKNLSLWGAEEFALFGQDGPWASHTFTVETTPDQPDLIWNEYRIRATAQCPDDKFGEGNAYLFVHSNL
jgi:hypothetical protein